ncbi:MAG TPA: TraR/DksA C4-type zinc finger protein [Roseococcus sp.]|jgi:phage/conjugal plasmid C-4 type zinc finger TraR family protein|nr:TraR/DksA C4-type zinc finger protein [Roseococcus sp.]
MPDDMDLAADRETVWLARTIEAHRPRPQPGRLECEDCEEPIPELRRQAAPWAVCCVRCQQARESRHGR